MSRQLDLDSLFAGQKFSPRSGLEPRDWQGECLDVYIALAMAHLDGGMAKAMLFTILAAPGAGKTIAVGLIAMWLLNQGLIDQIIYVCPNRKIKRQAHQVLREFFGIDLFPLGQEVQGEKAKSILHINDGVPAKYQGYVTTYSGIKNHYQKHREVASYRKTLVIFDEVHHLGRHPDLQWGQKARLAFDQVPFVISLTGTPYASKDVPMEFASYGPGKDAETLVFRADPASRTGFTYSLGRAVAEGVCRKPKFVFYDATVKIRPPGGPEILATFDDKVSEKMSSERLRGAVLYGSSDRNAMLRRALERCRQEEDPPRKIAIFLGGDSRSEIKAREDATTMLPTELEMLGHLRDHIDVFTGDDTESLSRMDHFEESGKYIAISISMMSEGSDFPTISAVMLLTIVMSLQTTIQRIGRGLRTIGEPGSDPWKTCLVFCFRTPELMQMAEDMEEEMEVELKKHEEKEKRKRDEATPHQRTEAIGVGDGQESLIMFAKKKWTPAQFNDMQAFLKSEGLPSTMLHTALQLMILERAKHGDGKPV